MPRKIYVEVQLYSSEERERLTAELKYGKRKPYLSSEAELQKSMKVYCDAKKLLMNHPPNESIGTKTYYMIRGQMGTRSGWPDLEIMRRNEKYGGLFIELKVKRNKPTDKQLQELSLLTKEGYYARWVNNQDDAMELIEKYLSNGM